VTALRRLARVAPLAALGVAGFLLGSCGGGDSALTTGTGLTATRPARTAIGPVVTRTTPTVPTRTNESPTGPVTTAPAPATTESVTTDTEPSEPPVTVTTVETETTLIPIPTTTATTAEPASSTDSTPWEWIALALALAAAAVLGLVLLRRRRTSAASWSRRLDDLSRRSLLALDDVVAQGSLVTGGVETLADEARSLELSAPDDQSSSAAAALRVRLDDLAAALEADRKLRLGSTPPSEEQLAYSTALVHHEVEQLQSHLRAGASSA
jgi:MYXO-CTERM domain-containing protein